MLKNNKGITMVALVIVIIVMIIISGIVIYEGSNVINTAKEQSIVTNMLLIQAKARAIQDKHEFENATYIGTLIEETSFNSLKEELNLPDGKVYVLKTQSDIDQMNIDVSGENKYAVDYENDKVYYLEGVEDKKTKEKYYTLEDIQNMEVNLVDDSEESEE